MHSTRACVFVSFCVIGVVVVWFINQLSVLLDPFVGIVSRGAGKTGLGEYAAKVLGRRFVDNDHLLEKEIGSIKVCPFKQPSTSFQTRLKVLLRLSFFFFSFSRRRSSKRKDGRHFGMLKSR